MHPRYKGSSLNASFVSDLSDLLELYRLALWIHGHMRDSFDYVVGGTRVIANPRGYHNENAGFELGLVVEV